MVEHLPFKQRVDGSKPSGLTNKTLTDTICGGYFFSENTISKPVRMSIYFSIREISAIFAIDPAPFNEFFLRIHKKLSCIYVLKMSNFVTHSGGKYPL